MFSVYRSVRLRTNVFKFIYVIHILYRKNWRENGMYEAKGSSTQKFSDTLRPVGRKF